jgi:hypothetical protein
MQFPQVILILGSSYLVAASGREWQRADGLRMSFRPLIRTIGHPLLSTIPQQDQARIVDPWITYVRWL